MPKRLRRRTIARRHDADQEPSLSVIREDDYEPVPDQTNTNALTPPNVLRLQNTHGNQAVQRMIANQKNTAPSNVVQRGVFDWMMETAESIARPYIEYGKMIWEQAQAQKAAQAASGQTPAPATTPQAPDPATEALEEAADQEVKLAKAKLLTDDQAKVERQRALDQARYTAEEQKEIDAIGIEKLTAELTTKRAELTKITNTLKKSRTSLDALKAKLKRNKKPDKAGEIQKQIDDLNKAITDDAADEKKLKERVAVLKAIVRKHGYEGAMKQMETALGGKDEMVKWFNEFDPNATFLGVKIKESDKSDVAGVHKKMSEALQKAEAHLMSLPQYAGKEPIEVAEALGIRRISGLRQPKKSASSDNISPHCYGLAIDINAMANPYVGLNTYKVGKETRSFTAEVVIRAAQALGRSEKNIRTLPSKDVGEMWDFLEEASDSMRDYFALRNDETALQEAAKRLSTPDKPVTAEELKKQIEEDYKWLYDKSDFKAPTEAGAEERDPAKGFMDLPKELVVALVEAGGLTWGGMFKTAKDIQHFQLNGVLGNDED